MIPSDGSLDSTLALLREGYRFIPNRCERLGSDMFRTRLMLRPAICIRGEEAARIFYTPGRFTRRGALPPTTLRLLQDKGSAATLDNRPHRHRKSLFMGLMTPEAVERAADLMEEEWRARLPAWEQAEEVTLFPQAEDILTRTACRWAGVPLDEREADQRRRELGAMIHGAGSAGPRAMRGLVMRRRTERWARELIRGVRDGTVAVPHDTPLHRVATWRELSGEPMDEAVAAVELLNLLRPMVAVDRYIVFTALALHEHPVARPAPDADEGEVERFVQEVRRLAPFFPAVGGRVLEPFEWRGHRFGRGDWVLLDLYGTNRDSRTWRNAHMFRPSRFKEWDGSPDSLVPQGAGDHHTGHRCPGEWITIALMKRAVRLLTAAMEYEVPPQDLRVPLNRMPTGPASGFRIGRVRRAGQPSVSGSTSPRAGGRRPPGG
ncbi:cytochrome P450 [Indioceanicola profundi]|uniref:cytochrome P450 n=1 Tax=Indioceanicola profundi TaxID=2220096 RepID=UPI000E6ADC07|nr:cytochrome P450 [Indioceanicola profundi]